MQYAPKKEFAKYVSISNYKKTGLEHQKQPLYNFRECMQATQKKQY